MDADRGNLFAGVPVGAADEAFTALLERRGLKIERIVSNGQASPPGFWYDSQQEEWVLLLEGSAAVQIEGEAAPRLLQPGTGCACRHIAAIGSRGPRPVGRRSGWRCTTTGAEPAASQPRARSLSGLRTVDARQAAVGLPCSARPPAPARRRRRVPRSPLPLIRARRITLAGSRRRRIEQTAQQACHRDTAMHGRGMAAARPPPSLINWTSSHSSAARASGSPACSACSKACIRASVLAWSSSQRT